LIQLKLPRNISTHVSTRQYARIVHHWAEAAGLDSSAYGTAFHAEDEGRYLPKPTLINSPKRSI